MYFYIPKILNISSLWYIQDIRNLFLKTRKDDYTHQNEHFLYRRSILLLIKIQDAPFQIELELSFIAVKETF